MPSLSNTTTSWDIEGTGGPQVAGFAKIEQTRTEETTIEIAFVLNEGVRV